MTNKGEANNPMYVYIIECADGSLYTGIAKDVVTRLREHFYRLPNCAKYTRSHQMTGIKAIWQTEDKVTACQMEYRIKRLSRKQKDILITHPEKAVDLPIVGKLQWITTEEQQRIFELIVLKGRFDNKEL